MPEENPMNSRNIFLKSLGAIESKWSTIQKGCAPDFSDVQWVLSDELLALTTQNSLLTTQIPDTENLVDYIPLNQLNKYNIIRQYNEI